MSLPLFLASLTDLPKTNRSFGKVPSMLLSDVFVIVGVGLGLLVLLASVIYMAMRFRHRRRRVSSGEKVYRGAHSEKAEESKPEEKIEEDDEDDDDDLEDDEPSSGEQHHHQHHSRRRYKYRVRRRSHRSRNPTLSETGGLPPVKAQEPSKPC